jgi:hypothetical protein
MKQALSHNTSPIHPDPTVPSLFAPSPYPILTLPEPKAFQDIAPFPVRPPSNLRDSALVPRCQTVYVTLQKK